MTATSRFGILLVGGLLAAPAVASAQSRGQQQAQQAQPAAQPAPAPPPPARVAPPPMASPRPTAVVRSAPPASVHAPAPPARVSVPERPIVREGTMPRTILRDPSFASASASSDDQQRARRRDTSGLPAQPSGVHAVPRENTRVAGPSSGNPNNVATPRRPRGDRPSYGTAVPRTYDGHGGHHGGGYYYPGSSPWWWDSYPYSFGFFAWDPFWWGASYPAYPGYPASAGYPPYAYPPSSGYFYGGVRLKVKPREAEVYVDGYFAGRVDDYDGAFQKLNLVTGAHHIEIQAPGFEPLAFDVNIQVDQTVTYRGELEHQ